MRDCELCFPMSFLSFHFPSAVSLFVHVPKLTSPEIVIASGLYYSPLSCIPHAVRSLLFSFFLIFFYFWPHHAASGILVPGLRIGLVPPLLLRHRVLTIGSPGKSHPVLQYPSKLYLWKPVLKVDQSKHRALGDSLNSMVTSSLISFSTLDSL